MWLNHRCADPDGRRAVAPNELGLGRVEGERVLQRIGQEHGRRQLELFLDGAGILPSAPNAGVISVEGHVDVGGVAEGRWEVGGEHREEDRAEEAALRDPEGDRPQCGQGTAISDSLDPVAEVVPEPDNRLLPNVQASQLDHQLLHTQGVKGTAEVECCHCHRVPPYP